MDAMADAAMLPANASSIAAATLPILFRFGACGVGSTRIARRSR
jgi:hypothetical protein